MKKIAIISVSSVLALLGVIWAVLNFVVLDAEAVRAEIQTVLADTTGRDVIITPGNATLFPPQMIYPGVRIGNIEGAATRDFLSVSSMTVRLSAFSLLTFSPEVESIVLDGAVIDFEALPGGRKNWQFSSAKQDGGGFHSYFLDTPIHLKSSQFRYANSVTGAMAQLSGLNGALRYVEGGKAFSYEGEVMLNNGEADVVATVQSVDPAHNNR